MMFMCKYCLMYVLLSITYRNCVFNGTNVWFWGSILRSSCDLFFTAKNSLLSILPQLLFWLRNIVTLITPKAVSLILWFGKLYYIQSLCDKVFQWRSGFFSVPSSSSANKNDSHDITKILLNAMFKNWLPLK